MTDFHIKEDGVIVFNNRTNASRDVSSEERLYAEYNQIVYDMGHQDWFTPAQIETKKRRMKEIEETIKVNSDKSLQMKRARLRAQMANVKISGDNRVLWESVSKIKKENG